MTIEKAYELITNIVQGDGTDMIKEKDEALYYAQKAMEKQMPKKPKKREYFYCENCERCGSLVTPIMDYCRSCGQKIDWSDLK